MITPPSAPSFGLCLRSVAPGDAAFIVEQRRASRAAPFLGDTSADLAQQRRWIDAQRARPNDFYWLCQRSDGLPLGTIGLYGITSTEAEWGRFVIRPEAKAAPGCLLLALTFAFETQALLRVYCTTVRENLRAIHFYERAGLVLDAHHRGQVVLRGRTVDTVLHRLERPDWPGAKRNLSAAASSKESGLWLF